MNQSERSNRNDVDQEIGNSLSELERQLDVYKRRGYKHEAERLDGVLQQMRGMRNNPRSRGNDSDNQCG